MFAVVWEYEVRAGAEAAFEALYGADGDWVALFRAYPGHLGTELLRGEANRYLTIDRWASAAAYDIFLRAAATAYARLDARGDALTLAERHLGTYTTP